MPPHTPAAYQIDGYSLAVERQNVHAVFVISSVHPVAVQPRRRLVVVARRPNDLPSDPPVVVLNPDDDVTAESFALWLDRRQVGEPVDPACEPRTRSPGRAPPHWRATLERKV
jgi:hypothetical protein